MNNLWSLMSDLISITLFRQIFCFISVKHDVVLDVLQVYPRIPFTEGPVACYYYYYFFKCLARVLYEWSTPTLCVPDKTHYVDVFRINHRVHLKCEM